MTQMKEEDTRNLGIEFERRIQAIDPTTEVVGKMDTDDIYSYLNQYQDQYIKSLYLADGQAQSQTRPSIKIQDALKPLLKQSLKKPLDTDQGTFDYEHTDFELPGDYYMYVRSVSHITSSYQSATEDSYAQNIMLKQEDAQKVIEAFYDKNRILRNPVCTLVNDTTLEVIHDAYTTIDSINITYIKQPNKFGWINGEWISCELPLECFDDLVSGAVELYFNYKYKATLASQAARRNATRRELGTDQQPTQQTRQQTQEAEE